MLKRGNISLFAKIDSIFWADDKTLKMTPAARYLLMYLLTCPHHNILGLFRMPKGYALEDTGLTEKQFTAAWDEVIESGIVIYDETHKVVLVKNFMKYHPIDNGNQAKAAVIRVHELPKSPLLKELAIQLRSTNREVYTTVIQALEERAKETVTKTHTERVTETLTETHTETCIDVNVDVDANNNKSTGKPSAPMHLSAEFEKLWELYPRKEGKKNARAAFDRARKKGVPYERIEAGIKRYAEHVKNTDPKYIMQGSTWFNQERWDDEYKERGEQSGGTSIHTGTYPKGMFITDDD